MFLFLDRTLVAPRVDRWIRFLTSLGSQNSIFELSGTPAPLGKGVAAPLYVEDIFKLLIIILIVNSCHFGLNNKSQKQSNSFDQLMINDPDRMII